MPVDRAIKLWTDIYCTDSKSVFISKSLTTLVYGNIQSPWQTEYICETIKNTFEGTTHCEIIGKKKQRLASPTKV